MCALSRKTSKLKLAVGGVLMLVGVRGTVVEWRHVQGIFRFEDYSNHKEVEIALLEMHPIGTPVVDLEKTLIKAGSQCHYNTNEYGKFLGCTYTQKGIFSYDKSVSAKIMNNGEIEFIRSSSYINIP